ncbi:uncharacterized protein BXZ73DRAFT_42834 [Epithele typhae]|uniref:uncharacterized protein n=1 Tax=Epithele typhae TaxID=378194 RepID=UPI0020088DC5|nr:uncharacterized protein BXZ73DRAFT_42834 [Epithele typhae]KAH9940373.1 hypothetical protein BXZ73DRAFT_42834 [Epithele typhae]
MFPPAALPLPGEVLLLTDELPAPADFLLHRFLAAHMKRSPQSSALILSVSQDLGWWKGVTAKSSLNYGALVDAQRLLLIEVVPSITADPTARAPFEDLFLRIRAALSTSSDDGNNPCLVILDDVSALEWIGLSVDKIANFLRALSSLCRRAAATLIIRHHIITPGEPDDVLRRLVQLCDSRLDVFPLSSGKSGSVSGQVALHRGPAVGDAMHATVARDAAVHYRLVDGGAVFFDRGTGSGVL